MPESQKEREIKAALKAIRLYRGGHFKAAKTEFEYIIERLDPRETRFYEFLSHRCSQLQQEGDESMHPQESANSEGDEKIATEMEAIARSGMFDADFYRETYPDISTLNDSECLRHFCEHGHKEGRRPNSDFFTRYYSSSMPKHARDSELNPLAYYASKPLASRQTLKSGFFRYTDYLSRTVKSIHHGQPRLGHATEDDVACLARFSIAVICHIHYRSAAIETLQRLNPLKDLCDIYITSSSENTLEFCKDYLSEHGSISSGKRIEYLVAPNKGRDILPFIKACEALPQEYKYILKVHAKKSADSEIISGSRWRDYCLSSLIGDIANVRSIIDKFEANPRTGLIYPPHYPDVFEYCTWGVTAKLAEKQPAIAKLLEIENTEDDIIDFPSGSMYWARASMLNIFFSTINESAIEEEPLPRDGSYLHFLERSITPVAKAAGYEAICHINKSQFNQPLIAPSQTVKLEDIVSFKVNQVKDLREQRWITSTAGQAITIGQPECSIIIPIYSNLEMTTQCLISVLLTRIDSNFEIIVVDDCSPDLLNIPLIGMGFNVVRNNKNLGFVGSCNRGAEMARGDKLVFLNNDTIVLDNWLRPLLDLLDMPDIGISGSMLLYPDGSLQEAGGCIWRDGDGLNYGRNGDPNNPSYNFRRDVDYCSGASLAIKRELFHSLGGFDSIYSPGYYEDTDLCFKTRAKNLRVVFEPNSKVIHLEGKSSEGKINGGMKKHQLVNKESFLRKWSLELRSYYKPTESRFFANRKKHSRVLLIDSFLPTPDKDSGSCDVFHMLKILDKNGYEVSFMASHEIGGKQKYIRLLQDHGVRVFTQTHQYHCADIVTSLKDEFEIAIIFRYDNFHRFADLMRAHNERIKIVYDTVDLHYLRMQRENSLKSDIKQDCSEVQLVKQAELAAMIKSDHVLLRSTHEIEILESEDRSIRDKLVVMPICREVVKPTTDFEQRNGIVFVGGYKHKPNIDAIDYFIGKVYPLIAKQDPNILLTIIGSHPELLIQAVPKVRSNNIKMVGHVSSLLPYLEACRLSIAPLRYGAGTKGKVISSMCHGVPCVASEVAAEGIQGLKHNENIMIASSSVDFATMCVELHNSKPLWEKISNGSIEHALQHSGLGKMEEAIMSITLHQAT